MEQVKPEVGMGATLYVGSDRYAYTIVEVAKNGRTIWVTGDSHTPAPGFDYYSNQVFTFESVVDGPRRAYTLRKNGLWIEKGSKSRSYNTLGIGHRRYYQDPSF